MGRLSREMTAGELRTLVAVVPEFVRRWRALEFAASGMVVIDGVERAGLRLLGGQHGRAGARYLVRGLGEVTVTGDEPDFLECAVAGDDLHGTVRVVDPLLPGELHLGLRGKRAELAVLGAEFTVSASAYGVGAAVGRVWFKRLRISGKVSAKVRGRRVWVTPRLRFGPRGVLWPSVVAMPFVRRRAEAEFRSVLEDVRRACAAGDVHDLVWREFTAAVSG